MARVCMRPGCDRPAEVRLSYDTVSCQVWLDPVLQALGPVQEICEFHALRLTVPRGWVLRDRRVADSGAAGSPSIPVVAADAAGEAADAVSQEVSFPLLETTPAPAEVVSTAKPSRVPLTVGAPTPKIGGRAGGQESGPIRRRHPDSRASELFSTVPNADPSVTEAVDGAAEIPSDHAEPESAEPETQADPALEAPLEETDGTPKSPLLARAFAQTGPQRSVLSDDLRVPDHKREGRKS